VLTYVGRLLDVAQLNGSSLRSLELELLGAHDHRQGWLDVATRVGVG
jgi:hypothetical protein